VSSLHDVLARAIQVLPAEDAHRLTIAGLRLGLGPSAPAPDRGLGVELAGLRLPSAIGLAAGFDKNAEVHAAMLRAGFGFVECGTVTPRPQAGNPRPRLFRLWADRAVINRMGFNNVGLERFGRNLGRSAAGVVGVNLGANKDSTDRIGDYVDGLTRLWGDAAYFTINISSPNTPGLRGLQAPDALADLLGRIAEARATLPGSAPIFLKVAPDLADLQIEQISDAVAQFRLDGVIVGNTTTSRPEGLRSARREEAGGLSGRPLMALSTQVLGRFREAARSRFALIGAGGVASGGDAYAKIRSGACAVQLYSAIVFEGPSLISRMRRDLLARMKADGFATIAEASAAA